MSTTRLFDGATWGLEYDSGAFDRRKPLPPGNTYCTDEVATHSNAGVGIDPSLRYNLFGGEVQTRPCDSEEELFKEITKILSNCLAHEPLFPGSIHMHIRVPYLLERPHLIKKAVLYAFKWWPHLAPLVHDMVEHHEGAFNVWNAEANKDIKTLTYPPESLVRMMQAPDNPKAIAAALHNNDTVMKNEWYGDTDVVKRPAVNFGHLMLNETIEFRAFVITTNPEILRNIIAFPARFLEVALNDDPDPLRIARGIRYQDRPFSQPYFGGLAEATTGYFTDIKTGIARALIAGDLTVADLNYPPYWINQGFE